MADDGPLTLGTAGHIDHGKTALVAALTGTDTDRLPQERERGISIELGYARLQLPGGRALSVVDVPGHERFVRTMVAGASGIDLFLMAVAADDGVMPQTREHAAVLSALGVARGVVAITKCDLADPGRALRQAADLLPAARALAVSARSGRGLDELRSALAAVAGQATSRDTGGNGTVCLHVDRAFTIRGAGTVVTGTLWSGGVSPGDQLLVLPARRRARIRGVQVHDREVSGAGAGQRVAINLAGIEVAQVARGSVLVSPGAGIEPAHILDVALELGSERHRLGGGRVHVHHGTRESPARVAALGGRFFQLRSEQPLMALAGDRLVVRQIAPPDTLGGGVVLDPRARRHGPSREALARLERLARGEPEPAPVAASAPPLLRPPPVLSAATLALEQRLREAGHRPPLDSELGPAAAELEALRAAGRAVRVGRSLHFHREMLAQVQERIVVYAQVHGSITIAQLRDELGTTRKFAQALLEHFDGEKVTRRVGDAHVLRRRPASGAR